MDPDVHWLAESGQTGPLEAALAAGADPDARDEDGRTPLHLAVRNRRYDAARILAVRGADLEAAEAALPRARALHLAVGATGREGEGDLPMIRELLERGANAGAADAGGVTPLHLAVTWCDAALVRLLLEKGARAGTADAGGVTPLHVACRRGATVLADVRLGDDGDRPAPRAARVDTALGRLEDETVLEALLDGGARVDAADAEGRTPLHVAAEHGHRGILVVLLAHGATADVADAWGTTPLHRAEDAAAAETLLKGGARADSADREGRTPLHAAVAAGRDDVVDLLLARGAAVGAADQDGRTPLHLAAGAGRALTVEKLIDGGADPNARDADGHTPMFWAEAAGHKLVVATLRRRGGKRREGRK